jgi:shikimate kinase
VPGPGLSGQGPAYLAIVSDAAYLAMSAAMFIQTQPLQLVLGYTPLMRRIPSQPP